VSSQEERGEGKEQKPCDESSNFFIRHHIPQPIRGEDEELIFRSEDMVSDFWITGHVRFQIHVAYGSRDSQDTFHTPSAPKYYSPTKLFDSNFFILPEERMETRFSVKKMRRLGDYRDGLWSKERGTTRP
jgi:hypothetical protein